jgi:glycine oxidase
MARGNIVVAGAGAVGSAIALTLARAGWRVTVADPAPIGANASGVAAGMLAPAFESLFDETASGHYGLLAAARDLWPRFAEAAGTSLTRDGAMAVGGEPQVTAWAARLAGQGAACRILEPRQAGTLAPGLRQGLWAALTPEDWRLDARASLAALRSASERLGARFVRGGLAAAARGLARIEGEPAPIAADLVVLATGAAQAPGVMAPELAALSPVKGHILRSSQPWPADVTIRGPGVYLCPDACGVILGASMEAGRADLAVEPAVVQALLAAADRFMAGLGERAWSARTGVRAATPDGLPLVGFSRAEGVILAVGARRNGWLLAPLIAGAVLDLVEGRQVAGPAVAFDPGRY